MPYDLNNLVREEYVLKASDPKLPVVREGRRTLLDESNGDWSVAHHVAGQLPYFYREPKSIARDFQERRNALDMIRDMVVKLPTTPKFQQSHFGEVLSSIFLEDVLGLRRLFCKLTMTTSENTNVHKMDGFFVDTSTSPFTFFAVEAKSSVLPTVRTKRRSHRSGILKEMTASLENYGPVDERFDFTTIRDNLEHGFSGDEASEIRDELVPPGPHTLRRIGFAVINECTINQDDDDYILTQACPTPFEFRGLTVTDLAELAAAAYREASKLKGGS